MLEASRAWLERLWKVEYPDGSSHLYGPIFQDAKDTTLFDVEGNGYTDLCGGFGVHILGHHPPEFKQVWLRIANAKGIVHGMGDVYATKEKVAFLETLSTFLKPYYERFALALSGGQAVELAMKTAMIKTGRSRFVAFIGSYHGLDLGSLNVTNRAFFRTPFDSWLEKQEVDFISFDDEGASLEQSTEILRDQWKKIVRVPAAVIVEPVQGRAGVRLARPEWLQELRRLCDESGALLVYDEILCGLMRAGRRTFSELVPADISCFGKIIGGGLPLSVCAGKEEVMMVWPENLGEGIHAGTFFGHPVSCSLGKIVLETLSETPIPKFVEVVLRKYFAHGPAVLRGTGLMWGIDTTLEKGGVILSAMLLKRGILAIPAGEKGEVLSLTPSARIDELTWDHSCSVILEQLQILFQMSPEDRSSMLT